MKKAFSLIGTLIIITTCSSFICSSAFAEDKNDAITYITDVISSGNSLIDKARKDQDVEMMNCVNNQLINAKGFLNVAESSTNNIKDAQTRNDTATVEHNERLISLAVSKVREIDMKMKQCASATVKFTGDTTLQAHRTCKFDPCETDPAFDPNTNEGQSAQEQLVRESSMPNVASPFI